MANDLLTPAIDGVGHAGSDRVVVGFNWTAVRTTDSVGLAWSPRGMAGAATTPETGSYGGRPLCDLAPLAKSDNPYERSIGLAAVNAHWNRLSPNLKDGDGLSAWTADPDADPAAFEEEMRRTCVVGRFPALDRKFPGATVIELDPRPGEIAFADAAPHLARADYVVMTASTLVNGTGEDLIAMVSPSAKITVLGPSVPLCPALLGGRIQRLAGFVVTDREGAFNAVMEGAGAKALKRFGRPVVLSADPAPGAA